MIMDTFKSRAEGDDEQEAMAHRVETRTPPLLSSPRPPLTAMSTPPRPTFLQPITSPYARPSTPIPPTSPDSDPLHLQLTRTQPPKLATSFSSMLAPSTSTSSVDLPPLRTRSALGDSMMQQQQTSSVDEGDEDDGDEARGGAGKARGQERAKQGEGGPGFDTLKSDLDFFFGGEGGLGRCPSGEAKTVGGAGRNRTVDGKWDGFDSGTRDGKVLMSSGRRCSRRDRVVVRRGWCA